MKVVGIVLILIAVVGALAVGAVFVLWRFGTLTKIGPFALPARPPNRTGGPGV